MGIEDREDVYLMKTVAGSGFSELNVLRCVFCAIAGLPRSRRFAFMRRYKIAARTNIRLPTSKHFGNNEENMSLYPSF